MQSAAGSLRGAGPSKSVKSENGTLLWGLGADALVLSGHYLFRLVKGAVSISGITLSLTTAGTTTKNANGDADSKWFPVSAPVAPFPAFTPAHSHILEPIFQVPEELAKFTAIIEVKQSSTPLNIGHLAPQYKTLWHNLQRTEITAQPILTIPPSWSDILSSRFGSGPERQFLVLGPKNSGKSSLARYLCNRLLLNAGDRRIYYLELDPGQPEFTPPGFLSLHLITDLNFSSAYAHADFRNTIKSHHLGYVSPMDTPRRYLAMCNDLLATFTSLPGGSINNFLVVNTPGWTRGLGLELNTEIANMLDPYKTCALHMGPSDFEIDDLVQIDKIEPSATDGSMSTITTSGFSSAELRALQISCYFHQHDPSHLTTWSPFELKLGTAKQGILSIAILDNTGVDLWRDWPICIEGTLVSINILDGAGDYELCLDDMHANDIWLRSTSIGMGVVQCVAEDRSSLRLLTPLNPQELDLGKKPVALVRGRIQLPVWEIYNKEIEQQSSTPWVNTSKSVGAGANYSKFRRNIRRN